MGCECFQTLAIGTDAPTGLGHAAGSRRQIKAPV